jgi:redox-sensitive bicupin YhaK (pirin superfamily)
MSLTFTQKTQGQAATDGAGVKLTRLLGTPDWPDADPFLMLDRFATDEPQDYLAGFPPHPHRGFETVTYLIEGRMRHADNQGNEGVIESGGAQWMTAGAGIVHSEMPEQTHGRLHGYQLWLNLPAKDKQQPASYRDIQPEELTEWTDDQQRRFRLLAGEIRQEEKVYQGPIQAGATQALFVDIVLPPNQAWSFLETPEHTTLLVMIEGRLQDPFDLSTGELRQVSGSGELAAGENGARFLLISGQPLNEPIARRGPFVMNTQAELEQAFADYRQGRF